MPTHKQRTEPTSKHKKRDEIYVKVDEMSKSLQSANEVLEKLQKRVNDSPVMNGGFDKLAYTIGNVGEKVDSIHDAVFNPDEGLFARIKISEAAQAEKVNVVARDVAVLQSWKSDTEKYKKQTDESTERLLTITKELEKQVADVNKWRTTSVAVMKWVGATMGTGVAGLVAKLVYEVIVKHM
jgi:hypothetical protein